MTASLGETCGFHPEILPSSLTKINLLGPDNPFLVTTKPDPELKTIPVGLPPSVFVDAGGTVTTRGLPNGTGTPSVLYSVETPVPLSAIQMVLLGEGTIPHGFT